MNNLTNLLTQLINLNSVTGNENKIGDKLEMLLSQNNFVVERQAVGGQDRTNLLATRGVDPSVLFYGHLDNVDSTKMVDTWETPPFELTEKDGRYYGIGASDMKGGMAAFLTAVFNTNTPVKLLLAVDEENISEGGWAATTSRPDFFNGIKLIISAEPSFGLGLHGITVGRTGRCLYQINFKGKSEHIIKYKEAVDSLKKLSEFGQKLYENRERMFKSTDTVVQIRKVWGESQGMSVCGDAGVVVEALIGATDSIESIKSELQKLTEDTVEIVPRKTPYLPGYHFKSFPHQETISRIIFETTGQQMELHVRKSVGDDNVLATLNIPVITWGPIGANEHKPNEYVEIDSLNKLSKMYTEFLKFIA